MSPETNDKSIKNNNPNNQPASENPEEENPLENFDSDSEKQETPEKSEINLVTWTTKEKVETVIVPKLEINFSKEANLSEAERIATITLVEILSEKIKKGKISIDMESENIKEDIIKIVTKITKSLGLGMAFGEYSKSIQRVANITTTIFLENYDYLIKGIPEE